MGCCPSSAASGEGREPLLAPSSQHTAAMEPPRHPLATYTPPTPSSIPSSSPLVHPQTRTHHKAKAKNEAARADVDGNQVAPSSSPAIDPSPPSALPASDPSHPSLTTTGLKVVDAPRAENMTKEEEFEFYKKKMEQLNREKLDINARFQQEEREKQKQLEKLNAKKSSLRNFFKGGAEDEAEFAIGTPQGFKHEAHIGWTPEGGFDIFNIPNEWKQLMTKAGVTEEQMQDKETAMFIVSFVASTLTTKQGAPLAPVLPVPMPKEHGSEQKEKEKEEEEEEIHQEEEISQEDKDEEESVPPSAPPAPVAQLPPALSSSSDPAVPPPPPALIKGSVAEEGSSGDMFSAIRGGVALKKVAALPDVKNLSVEEENTIAGALARALQSRRFALEEEESEEEEDNGEWED